MKEVTNTWITWASNGFGKTTVINTVLGLLKYNKGEIKVFDEKVKR